MKDYLEVQGFDVTSPRMAIQTGFQTELIKDGHVWLDALAKRNLMAHTYDEKLTAEAEHLIISAYYSMLLELHNILEDML